MKQIIQLHKISKPNDQRISVDMFTVEKFVPGLTETKLILKKGGFIIVRETLKEISAKVREKFVEEMLPPQPPVLLPQDIQDYIAMKISNKDVVKKLKIPEQNVVDILRNMGIYNSNNNGKKKNTKIVVHDEYDFLKTVGFLKPQKSIQQIISDYDEDHDWTGTNLMGG